MLEQLRKHGTIYLKMEMKSFQMESLMDRFLRVEKIKDELKNSKTAANNGLASVGHDE